MRKKYVLNSIVDDKIIHNIFEYLLGPGWIYTSNNNNTAYDNWSIIASKPIPSPKVKNHASLLTYARPFKKPKNSSFWKIKS